MVPRKYRQDLLSTCPEGTVSHLGVSKTKEQLLRYFYWPGCYKDVENYVRTCDLCQRVGKGGDMKKSPMKIVPVIEDVFSKINVDICGPWPESENGNRYIFTAICMASRYPEAILLKKVSSITIIDAFLDLFSRIGFPKEIQCDNGSYFVSALTNEFLQRLGIHVVHSSVYHPQSNPVERLHRTMKKIIRIQCYSCVEKTQWERQSRRCFSPSEHR